MTSIEKEIYYNTFIVTPRIKEIIRDIIECKKSYDLSIEPISMMVIGGTGRGKTSLINYIASKYPDSTEISDWGEQEIKEVLVVTLPSNSSKKDAATAMLTALGDPNPSKGNLLEQTDRLSGLLYKCQVKLIIIDEFSHIVQSNSNRILGKTADWIKDIIKPPKNNHNNCPQIPLIAFGVYNSTKILEANPQLGTLVSKKAYMFPFGISQEEELEYYRTFLSEVGNKISDFGIALNLDDPEIFYRIFAASCGIPRFVMKLIAISCAHAKSKNTGINIKNFQYAFPKVFGRQASNPFEEESLANVYCHEYTTYTTWLKSGRSHSILSSESNIDINKCYKTAKSMKLF